MISITTLHKDFSTLWIIAKTAPSNEAGIQFGICLKANVKMLGDSGWSQKSLCNNVLVKGKAAGLEYIWFIMSFNHIKNMETVRFNSDSY